METETKVFSPPRLPACVFWFLAWRACLIAWCARVCSWCARGVAVVCATQLTDAPMEEYYDFMDVMGQLKIPSVKQEQLEAFANEHAHRAYFTLATKPEIAKLPTTGKGVFGLACRTAFAKAAVSLMPVVNFPESINVVDAMQSLGLDPGAFADAEGSGSPWEALKAVGVQGWDIYRIRQKLDPKVRLLARACWSVAARGC